MLNLLIIIKPHDSARDRPLWMAAHASKRGDPLNLRHRRGKQLHHGGDGNVCSRIVVFRTSPTAGIPRGASCSFLSEPTAVRLLIGINVVFWITGSYVHPEGFC